MVLTTDQTTIIIYHKKVTKLFREEFNCLGKTTEKYKTFSVPTAKEVKKIDKNGKEIRKTIFYNNQITVY